MRKYSICLHAFTYVNVYMYLYNYRLSIHRVDIKENYHVNMWLSCHISSY